jgi:protein TonB
MIAHPRLPRIDRRLGLRLGVGAAVAALQFGLISALGLVGPSPSGGDFLPVIEVELMRPPAPPPPPPPQPDPAPVAGGGAPAAPSRTHLAPRPPERPPELIAPPTPAPTQPLVIGVAPIATPEPGMGQGGQGEGSGTGIGDGDGPGSGGTPPMILRGPTPGEILGIVPPEARRARQAGRASINCVVRLDHRLDDCRVVGETPSGFRFGEAGLRAADFFRYRPPTSASGRPLDGQRVTISVMFGRQ